MGRTLGDNVLPLLEQRGLSRAALMKALDVKQSTLSEQLGSDNPRLETLFRYANFLKCSISALVLGLDPDYDGQEGQRGEAPVLTQLRELVPSLTETQQLLVLNLARTFAGLSLLPSLVPSRPETTPDQAEAPSR